jgi:small subunit ribosomal protein S5
MTEENKAVTEKKDSKGLLEKTQQDQKNDRRRGRGGKGRVRNNRRSKEPKEFEESVIQIDRVTRVTKGGRQLRFRVSVVIGDKKGRVGFGIGKSSEVMAGVQKAIAKAKRNLITVPVYEDSIPHEVIGKFKASQVLILPAPEGKGIIAGGAVRKILELSGIKNVLSKMHGSRNKINSSYATMQALVALQNRVPKAKKEETVKTKDVETKKVAKKASKKTEKKSDK